MYACPENATWPIVISRKPLSATWIDSVTPILWRYWPKVSSPSRSARRLSPAKLKYRDWRNRLRNSLKLGHIAWGDRNPRARAAGRFRRRLSGDRPGVVVVQWPFVNQPSFILDRTRGRPNSLQMRNVASYEEQKKSAPESIEKPSTFSPRRRPPA